MIEQSVWFWAPGQGTDVHILYIKADLDSLHILLYNNNITGRFRYRMSFPDRQNNTHRFVHERTRRAMSGQSAGLCTESHMRSE